MPIKPEELYTNKDKQQEYPQIYNGDELVAIVISFPLKEEEETIEVAVEETEPSINATEILSKGSVDIKLLKKKDKEQEDEEIKKLREKLKGSENGFNLKETDPINPITQAHLLYNTSLSKLAKMEESEYNITLENLTTKEIYNLLKQHIITSDTDIFNDALDRLFKEEDYSYWLLINNIVSKDHSRFNEIFTEALNKGYGYSLLKNKVITREDGELFEKAVNSVKESDSVFWLLRLLRDKIISKEEYERLSKMPAPLDI